MCDPKWFKPLKMLLFHNQAQGFLSDIFMGKKKKKKFY